MRMTVRILFLISFLLSGCVSNAPQTVSVNDDLESYFSHLPSHLELQEESPQKYLFTCDYFQLDIQGNLIRKQRFSAEYTRALPDGSVRWNNVSIAQAKGLDDVFPEGEKQDYMEGFTYKLSDPNDMMKPEFFQGFPASVMETRNLVWDTHMIEGFGWSYFDKLQLNRTYRPPELTGEVPLAGAGTFQNRQVELTWIGISQMNEEPCALIQYRAFFNKINASFEGLSLKGGSHYWGEIWVSLKDKQIEYATLYETVLMEIKIAGQQTEQLVNVFRKATFQKFVATRGS